MFFRRKKIEEPVRDPDFFDRLEAERKGGGRVFFETVRRPGQAYELREANVLDLRPPEQREPKRINHYYEGDTFYEAIPGSLPREMPFAFSLARIKRSPREIEASELVALAATAAIILLIGVALIYSALA